MKRSFSYNGHQVSFYSFYSATPITPYHRMSSSSTLFKHLLLKNHWANQRQIPYRAFMGWGKGQMVLTTWPRWLLCPYMVNLKKSSSPEPYGWWPWNLVCIIGCSSTIKFAQMMTLGWPLPISWQGQIWSLMLFYGKKLTQWTFQKLLLFMIWN